MSPTEYFAHCFSKFISTWVLNLRRHWNFKYVSTYWTVNLAAASCSALFSGLSEPCLAWPCWMNSDMLRNCSQFLVAEQLGTCLLLVCWCVGVLVCWWVFRSSYYGPCVVRTVVIWTPGWCGHFWAKCGPIFTIEFIITVCYYHYSYYYTLRYSISALRTFTVALSWFFSVTHTKEFPLRRPDSLFIRTSLPHRIAKTCDEFKAVFRDFRSCVSLTVTAQWNLSALPVKLCRVDLCVLYDFFCSETDW